MTKSKHYDKNDYETMFYKANIRQGKIMLESLQTDGKKPKQIYQGDFSAIVHSVVIPNVPETVQRTGNTLSSIDGTIHLCQSETKRSLRLQFGTELIELGESFVIEITDAKGQQIWPQAN